jgi:hypothetical protein
MDIKVTVDLSDRAYVLLSGLLGVVDGAKQASKASGNLSDSLSKAASSTLGKSGKGSENGVAQVVKENTNPATDTPVTKGKYTEDQVRKAALTKARAGFKEEVKALAKSYNADNVSTLDPAKYEEYMEKLNAIR